MVRVSAVFGLAFSASLFFGGGALAKSRVQLLAGAPAVQLNGDAAYKKFDRIGINSGAGHAGSAYIVTPLTLGATGSFTSTFDVSLWKNAKQALTADGVAFVIQNDPAGAGALGSEGSCLAVCDITNYAAIVFQSYSNDQAGLWLNGTTTTQPMSLGAQTDQIEVTVSYKGAAKTLSFSAYNRSTGQTVSNQYAVDLSTLGTSLYLGFSGASGGVAGREVIHNWKLKVTNGASNGNK